MSALLTGVVAAGTQPLAGGTAPAVVTQGGVAAVPGVAPMVDTEGSEVAVPPSQSPVGAVCWVSPPCGEQAWDSGSLMGRSSRMQDPSRLKEGSGSRWGPPFRAPGSALGSLGGAHRHLSFKSGGSMQPVTAWIR
uniref:Putative secreted protein n=1 Tax=Ixodes ricinus TaxID=34613 RepID=A0A6B0USM2_IXORI